MSSRVDDTWEGFPSQEALLITVCPSGAKRATEMCPRRNVSGLKTGCVPSGGRPR